MTAALTTLPGEELTAYLPHRPSAATYWRRRLWTLAVLVVLVAASAWGLTRGAAALGDGPASGPERRPAPVTYTVERGDTLWSIARELQPQGDTRALVRALADTNGGPELEVGDRLVVP